MCLSVCTRALFSCGDTGKARAGMLSVAYMGAYTSVDCEGQG